MAGSVKKVAVDLFYDIMSPYSYIAFEVLTRLGKKKDTLHLKLQPTLLGGVLNHAGNQTPITVPAKVKYMAMDLERVCKYYNIPYKYPANALPVMHAKGSLSTQRLLVAVQENFSDQLEPLTQHLYRGLFFRDTDVTEPKNLIEACKNVGFSTSDSESLLLLTKDCNIKQKLKDQVEMALNYGAFGLPSCVAHLESGPELFFGCDRLPLLVDRLGIANSHLFNTE